MFFHPIFRQAASAFGVAHSPNTKKAPPTAFFGARNDLKIDKDQFSRLLNPTPYAKPVASNLFPQAPHPQDVYFFLETAHIPLYQQRLGEKREAWSTFLKRTQAGITVMNLMDAFAAADRQYGNPFANQTLRAGGNSTPFGSPQSDSDLSRRRKEDRSDDVEAYYQRHIHKGVDPDYIKAQLNLAEQMTLDHRLETVVVLGANPSKFFTTEIEKNSALVKNRNVLVCLHPANRTLAREYFDLVLPEVILQMRKQPEKIFHIQIVQEEKPHQDEFEGTFKGDKYTFKVIDIHTGKAHPDFDIDIDKLRAPLLKQDILLTAPKDQVYIHTIAKKFQLNPYKEVAKFLTDA